jgi:membrane protease YdiL (CAAX protease family)
VTRRPLPDQLRVPWKILDAVVVFLAAWIVLPIVAVLVLRLASPYVPLAHELIQRLVDGDIAVTFGLTLVDALAALGLLLLYLRRYKVGWPAIGWRKFDVWQAAKYLLVIFVVFVILTNITLKLISLFDPSFDQVQRNDFIDSAGTHPGFALIALVLLPPIIEETVFRGFIFPAFAQRWGVWAGAIASSVLFGIAHLQANVTIYTFLLGMLLCYMYVRLRSIYPGMILHMLNNYLAYLALTGAVK